MQSTLAQQTQRPPNIIFFTWHDAGDWFGCYGYDTVQTPNVDRLASEGVRFANNFSACAICSPSRAAIMTGRHPQNTGLMRLANTVFDDRIYPHLTHTAKRVKGMGYHTALFGVQHEAAHAHVNEIMNFDERFATDPWPSADITAHYASQWLRDPARKEEPFYMQVGTLDAHLNRFYSGQPPREDEPYPPVQDREKGLHMPPYLEDNEAGRRTVATLQGLLQRGDRLMGAILDALEATGQAENTLVVMCVDHGVGLPRAKTTGYDPGLRTGWLIRWPGKIPAGHVVNGMSTHVDVLPTLAELLDWQINDTLDGMSLANAALGQTADTPRQSTVAHMVEDMRCLRTKRYKLIRNFSPSSNHAFKGDCAKLHRSYTPDRPAPTAAPDQTPNDTFPALELYDLEKDPHERENRAADPALAQTLSQLDAELWDFLLDNNDFVVHAPVRGAWDAAIRAQLVAHCERTGRSVPPVTGPYADPIDAATARGTIVS